MSDNVSRRTGLIAEKLGMTLIFDNEGKALGVTLLKAVGNIVLDNKTKERDGYNSVVIGFGERKLTSANKSLKGMCAKVKSKPVKIIKEFRVSGDALVEPGNIIDINHFVVGQHIDVHGENIGKGFAGAMKRWNFRGLEATHGVSVTHRSHGSTGQRQDPGKTFRGKKMAGHMGTEQVTVQNIKILKIDNEFGIIAVNGSVPGKKGTFITITDAVKLALPGNAKYPAAIIRNEQVNINEVQVDENATQQQG